MPNIAPEFGSAPPIVADVAIILANAAGSTPVAKYPLHQNQNP